MDQQLQQIKEIFDLKLKPLENSIHEQNKLIQNLLEKTNEQNERINIIEYDIKDIRKDVTANEKLTGTFDKRIDVIEIKIERSKSVVDDFLEHKKCTNEKLKKLDKDIFLIRLISKNPRLTLIIIVALYLFAISNGFDKITGIIGKLI